MTDIPYTDYSINTQNDPSSTPRTPYSEKIIGNGSGGNVNSVNDKVGDVILGGEDIVVAKQIPYPTYPSGETINGNDKVLSAIAKLDASTKYLIENQVLRQPTIDLLDEFSSEADIINKINEIALKLEAATVTE